MVSMATRKISRVKVPTLPFVAFFAYRLQVTLKQRSRSLASGLTPHAVPEKFATVQIVDVHLPITDGRQLILSRISNRRKTYNSCLAS